MVDYIAKIVGAKRHMTMIAERPRMTDGYGISQENAGMLGWEWVEEQMSKARNYWIASTHPQGSPHVTPVWGVWLEGRLYFASDRQARKSRNLQANPQVVVHLESGDEVVILEGAVEEVRASALFQRIAEAYVLKYPPIKPEETPGQVMYGVVVKTAMAWLEADFPNTATRWRVAP